jgi:uncharacterized membrane protein
MGSFTIPDLTALGLFILAWLAYEPMLRRLSRGAGAINTNMTVVRCAWMQNMASRELKLVDSQLMGHVINSASFFASSNMIIIAAAAGVLFGGDNSIKGVLNAPLVEQAPRWLFEIKLALIVVALARGLLDFIWSLRQMNYCIAAIGATPEYAEMETRAAFGRATAKLLNPAITSFNAGVRGYYFALAAAAWLAGPIAFAAATLGAMTLLVWRQRNSQAAEGIRDLRALLEAQPVLGVQFPGNHWIKPQEADVSPTTPPKTPIGQDTPVPPTPQ